MSLYHMLNGVNPMAPIIFAALQLDPKIVPRFRDVRISRVDNKHYIVIHTRAGGGNRADYAEQITQMAAHSLYAYDKDCSHDNTYADFYYRVPQAMHQLIFELALVGRDNDLTGEQIFENNMAAIQKQKIPHVLPKLTDEQQAKLAPILDKLADTITDDKYMVMPMEDRLVEVERGEG